MGRDILDPRGAVGTQFAIDPLTGLPIGGAAAGVTGNIQFNNGGTFGADALLNWIAGSSTLQVGDPLVRTAEMFVSGITGPGLRLHSLLGSSGFGPVIQLTNDAVGATKSTLILFTNDAPGSVDLQLTSSTAAAPANEGPNVFEIEGTPNIAGLHFKFVDTAQVGYWFAPNYANGNQAYGFTNQAFRLFGIPGLGTRVLQIDQADQLQAVRVTAPSVGVTTHTMTLPATAPGAVQNAIIQTDNAGVQRYTNYQAGTGTLNVGTATINTATITAQSVITATHKNHTGACGVLACETRVVGNPGSFAVNSYDTTGAAIAADASDFDWTVVD